MPAAKKPTDKPAARGGVGTVSGKPDITDPRQSPPRTRTPRAEKPADSRADEATSAQKAYKTTLDAQHQIRIETMAHALIYDICQLRDVVARLLAMAVIDVTVIEKFLDYYAPRLQTLLEEDAACGEVTTLADLGEWRMLSSETVRLHENAPLAPEDFYSLLVSRLKKIELSAVQLGALLEFAAVGSRDQPSRGEDWIPKSSSRRASAQ